MPLTERLLGAFDGVACRPWAAMATAAALALTVCLATTASTGVPKPTIHDEFSYLLAADTFAHGRLTNPTHPMWQHFETMHVIQQPTYQSMYPPGHGLALAAGEVLGHPIVGVWLEVCAMAAAFVWMLNAYLPPRWALVGGLLAVSKLVILGQAAPYLTIGYWSTTYWGGALTACGGALLYGALPRIMHRPRIRESIILVVGLGVLAATRPLEGFSVALPAAVVLLVWICRRRGEALRFAALRCVVPVVLGLAMIGAGITYYNYRVTGSVLTMPWMLYHEQYALFPMFFFQPNRPEPTFRHDAMRRFHTGWEIGLSARTKRLRDFVGYTQGKAARLWRFYLGPVLALPLLMLPWLLRDPWMVLAAVGCSTVGFVNFMTFFVFPHYAAPAACLVFALVTGSLERLSRLRVASRPVGAIIACGIIATSMAMMVANVPASARRPTALARMFARDDLVRTLVKMGGKHLVIVRYQEPHAVHEEWVFNGADLDGAPVVFARDMGDDANRELLDYYADRRVWLLVVGDAISRPAPVPYPGRE